MLFIFTGIVSGIISGLGMGGGTILIIILTNFFDFSQHTAQASNAIFFIPTSIAALIIHFKENNIEKRIVLKMIPLAILGAGVGAFLSSKISAEKLRVYFGIFLLVIAMYEIVIIVKNKIQNNKKNDVNKIYFFKTLFDKKKHMKGE